MGEERMGVERKGVERKGVATKLYKCICTLTNQWLYELKSFILHVQVCQQCTVGFGVKG